MITDESTGVREVDDVLAEVRTLPQRAVADHVEILEGAHRRLRQVLAAD